MSDPLTESKSGYVGSQSPVTIASATVTQPYYADDLVTLYHGNSHDIRTWLGADVLVTDPPYGVAYKSNRRRDKLAASILGDTTTEARDGALGLWGHTRPALMFGSWRQPRPEGTRARLIWDTKGALGMGALDLPWKPSDQEIYVIGGGFVGRRDSNVITCAPVQATARNGRVHPHEKPVDLMLRLIDKCPPGVVADPFAGSGSTLVAAKRAGRRAIGVELDERYCEIAAQRLAQGALDFGEAS